MPRSLEKGRAVEAGAAVTREQRAAHEGRVEHVREASAITAVVVRAGVSLALCAEEIAVLHAQWATHDIRSKAMFGSALGAVVAHQPKTAEVDLMGEQRVRKLDSALDDHRGVAVSDDREALAGDRDRPVGTGTN